MTDRPKHSDQDPDARRPARWNESLRLDDDLRLRLWAAALEQGTTISELASSILDGQLPRYALKRESSR